MFLIGEINLILEASVFMDINCTDTCRFQTEGKCHLETIPSFTQSVSDKSTCPYFHATNAKD